MHNSFYGEKLSDEGDSVHIKQFLKFMLKQVLLNVNFTSHRFWIMYFRTHQERVMGQIYIRLRIRYMKSTASITNIYLGSLFWWNIPKLYYTKFGAKIQCIITFCLMFNSWVILDSLAICLRIAFGMVIQKESITDPTSVSVVFFSMPRKPQLDLNNLSRLTVLRKLISILRH